MEDTIVVAPSRDEVVWLIQQALDTEDVDHKNRILKQTLLMLDDVRVYKKFEIPAPLEHIDMKFKVVCNGKHEWEPYSETKVICKHCNELAEK